MRGLTPILLAALLLAPAAGRAATTRALPVDGYAAIVNERVITVGDVMDFVQGAELQLRDTYDGEELAKKRQEAYETGRNLLIEQALILEEFAKAGGAIPDRLVNDRIDEFIFDRFQNDRARFLQALAEEQITMDEWRERTRDRIIVSVLRRQEVFDRIKIGPADLLAAYEKGRARYAEPERVRLHMMVFKKTSDAARDQAVLSRGRVLAGESFEDVATAVSEDPRAAEGGDWGWLETRLLRDELKQAAAQLQPGELSDLVDTPEAVYLMRLDERQAAKVRSLEEARPDIEKELRAAEADRLYRQWMDRLKRKHFVQVF